MGLIHAIFKKFLENLESFKNPKFFGKVYDMVTYPPRKYSIENYHFCRSHGFLNAWSNWVTNEMVVEGLKKENSICKPHLIP